MLLNFCFFTVNLSFTTGMPQPGTQKGSGKMIFPPLESNRLFHTASVCGRQAVSSQCKCTLPCSHKEIA